jgi:uncharacterized lipoprotein YddW (UPF0748 family)
MEAFRTAMRQTLPAAERRRIDGIEGLDPFAYPEELADEWRRFRTTRLTSLVAHIRTAIRSARPDAVVSAAVVPGSDLAMEDYLQDWRTWVDNGFVDAVTGTTAPVTTLLFSYETLVDPPEARASAAAPPGTSSP